MTRDSRSITEVYKFDRKGKLERMNSYLNSTHAKSRVEDGIQLIELSDGSVIFHVKSKNSHEVVVYDRDLVRVGAQNFSGVFGNESKMFSWGNGAICLNFINSFSLTLQPIFSNEPVDIISPVTLTLNGFDKNIHGYGHQNGEFSLLIMEGKRVIRYVFGEKELLFPDIYIKAEQSFMLPISLGLILTIFIAFGATKLKRRGFTIVTDMPMNGDELRYAEEKQEILES